MELLAIYTNEDPPRIILRDIESRQFVHVIEPTPDTRQSLYWRAVDYAARNGHKIAETDRSSLTNGECDPHHDDIPEGIHILRDGNAYRATGPGFVNLQESVAGFGYTPAEAVRDLASKAN